MESVRKPRWLAPVALLLPAAALVAGLMYWPMFETLRQSLYSSSFLNPTPSFIGLGAYGQMLTDPVFWQIVRNSITWTLGAILAQNFLGFMVALLLNNRLPGQGILRSIVLLPWILPGVVVAILWRFIYDPQLGLINSVFMRLGFNSGVDLLGNPTTAMAAVIGAAIWKGFPFCTVIYLAALQGVDHEQIEAATVDGAGPGRRILHVVLPAIWPVVAVNLLLTSILTFNYFDLIYMMTRGGPLNATAIFPTRIYELGFGQFRFGDASAYGAMSVLVLIIFVGLIYLTQRRTRA